MTRLRAQAARFVDLAAHPGTVTAVLALFVFWLGFAVGNSLITRQALSEQRALYMTSLSALRDNIHQDRLADWNRHRERPNGGTLRRSH